MKTIFDWQPYVMAVGVGIVVAVGLLSWLNGSCRDAEEVTAAADVNLSASRFD